MGTYTAATIGRFRGLPADEEVWVAGRGRVKCPIWGLSHGETDASNIHPGPGRQTLKPEKFSRGESGRW